MNASLSPRRVMIYTASVLFVAGIAWLLLKIHSILIILILGIILATAIEPFVLRLRRRGLSRGQAILAIYLMLGIIFGTLLYLVVPPLTRQAVGFVSDIPELLLNLEEQARESNSAFIRTTGVAALDRAHAAFQEYRERPPVEGATAIDFVTSVVGVIFTVVSVLIVAFYWMTEKATIKRLTLSLFPIDKRDEAHEAWDEIEAKLGGWTRGEAILMTAVGSVSAAAYWVIGLDFWLALGIFAGITEMIPFIGPILAGSTAFIIAITDSWQKALLVVVIVFAIQQLEGAFLVPRVMENAVGLSPLAVVLAVFIGGVLLGVVGAIIAIPIAAAVQVLVQHLLALDAADADVLDAPAPATPDTPPPIHTGALPVEHEQEAQEPDRTRGLRSIPGRNVKGQRPG